MTVKNHWGIWIDSETPITGVINNYNVEWLNDEIYDNNSVDLAWEDFMATNPTEQEMENFETDDHTVLIGDWIKDTDGKYAPDPMGEYAAICREDVTQVMYSRYTKRCALCSPCYPGQGDLDNEGDWLAYTLPDDLIGFKDK